MSLNSFDLNSLISPYLKQNTKMDGFFFTFLLLSSYSFALNFEFQIASLDISRWSSKGTTLASSPDAEVLAHAVVEYAHLLEHLEVETIVVSGHFTERDREVLIDDASDLIDRSGSQFLIVGSELDDGHRCLWKIKTEI